LNFDFNPTSAVQELDFRHINKLPLLGGNLSHYILNEFGPIWKRQFQMME
jgi:hypothetical protein